MVSFVTNNMNYFLIKSLQVPVILHGFGVKSIFALLVLKNINTPEAMTD